MQTIPLIYWCGGFGAPQEITFANEAASDGMEWIRICAYGDARGLDEDGTFIQRFDRTAANEVVAAFTSNWNKLKRALGIADLPVFNGHPDHQKRKDDTRPQDFRVYSRISALEARSDGLYGLIRRTPELAALIKTLGTREISPRWDMAVANAEDAEKRIYRPVFLKSIGLVDKGNWPEKSVINEADTAEASQPQEKIRDNSRKFAVSNNNLKPPNSTGEKDMQWTEEQQQRLAEILGVDDPAQLDDPETLIAKVAALKPAQPTQEELDAKNAQAEAEKQKLEEAQAEAAQAKEKKEETEAANEVLVEKLLDFGIADGRICAADRAKWKARFGKDAANSADIFAELKPGSAVPVAKDPKESKAKTVANAAMPKIAESNDIEKRRRDRANEIFQKHPSLGFTEAYNRAAKEIQ